MVKRHYNKLLEWIDMHRYKLLLIATLLLLILPTLTRKGLIANILFVSCMSFLLIQSMVVATPHRAKRLFLRYIIVSLMIIIFWLDPAGFNSRWLEILRLALLAIFFVFVAFYLIKFLRRATSVNMNVIITSINIYLLFGIISGSLAYLCYEIAPDTYNIPVNITDPNFITFIYYSFVTMSTLGYGDITPRIPETQMLSYLTAVTGQLYLAIVIALLVGKFQVHNTVQDSEKQNN
jgi:hypothetical protein